MAQKYLIMIDMWYVKHYIYCIFIGKIFKYPGGLLRYLNEIKSNLKSEQIPVRNKSSLRYQV